MVSMKFLMFCAMLSNSDFTILPDLKVPAGLGAELTLLTVIADVEPLFACIAPDTKRYRNLGVVKL